MISHRHIVFWIAGGILVAIVLIYFAVSNGVVAPFAGNSLRPASGGVAPSSQTPGVASGPSSPPPGAAAAAPDPLIPTVSSPLKEAEIPTSAIKLSVTRGGFTPLSFTVREGEKITLSLTAGDGRSHAFVFENPALSSVAVGLAPNETRVVTFIAPKSGSYIFRDTAYGANQTGTMIVR